MISKLNFIIFAVCIFCFNGIPLGTEAEAISVLDDSGDSSLVVTGGSSIGESGQSDAATGRTIEGMLRNSSALLNRLAPFIISLTLLTFLWGMFQMVHSGSEESRKEGRQIIVFGVIALFVMVSIWGLVNLLIKTTGLSGASAAPQGPGVPRFK